VDLSGDTDNPVTTDFEGDTRDGSTPDIGFDEATALGDYIFAGAMTVTTAPVASELNYTPQNPVLAGALAIVIAFAATMAYTQFSESLWTPIAPTEFDTDYVPHDVAGTVYGPLTSGLQAALNAAQRGDIIVLADGSTHVGNFTLPGKSGTQPINIVSESFFNGPMAKGVGDRVDPSDIATMATIRTPNSAPAISNGLQGTDASYYRFEWINFDVVNYPAFVASIQYGVVRFFHDSSLGYTTVAELPRNLVLSHCIVNGFIDNPTFVNARNGVEVNCRECAVLDSYIYNIGMIGFESHGVVGWNGAGPHKVDNSYIAAPGINILFGGAGIPEASLGVLHSEDISITRNYLFKDEAWIDGVAPYQTVKNWIETKASKRYVARGNVCENTWSGQGQGYGVLYQNLIDAGFPVTQYQYQKLEDTHVIYNKFLNSGGQVNVPATVDYSGNGDPEPVTRCKIEHNLFYGIGRADVARFGRSYSPTGPGRYISFEFNTVVLGPGEVADDMQFMLLFAGAGGAHPVYGWPAGGRMRGNITCYGRFGVSGTGTVGNESWMRCCL
jgi:hypothetical protein